MKLTDLDAQFVRMEGAGYQLLGDDLANAQGVMFQCPQCAAGKKAGHDPDSGLNYVEGAHYIHCWFRGRGVPDDEPPGPGRWNPEGTGLKDLSFVGPGACSVWLKPGGCGAHFHVKNGEAG